MDQDRLKQSAAAKALEYLEDGMALGVGTGSTVNFFIEALEAKRPRLEAVVSSSNATTERLRAIGISPVELAQTGDLDLYVDGADEATEQRQLIKGGGGALTREKVLAAASRRFVCIVDESKLVPTLGAFPLPVEVIPMARSFVARQLIKLGGQPQWRENFVTDNGGHILDVHNLTIANAVELERRINQIPGVITVGLFAQRLADVLLIAATGGVRKL